MKALPRFVLTLVLTFVAAAGAQHAQNGTPQNPYPITGPTTITTAGYYQLKNSINSAQTSGNIITVNASNVTIDFNGFYIAGPVGNTTQTTYGITAYERSNLTVFNGTIAFCYRGISITGNTSTTTNNVGHRVEKMRLTYCYLEGVILSFAPSSLLADNQISQISGYTGYADASAYGISSVGAGITVRNNLITKVTALGSGQAVGIYGDPGVFIVSNTIANISSPSGGAYGVASGKYKDNLTYSCVTPFFGGSDAGGNN